MNVKFSKDELAMVCLLYTSYKVFSFTNTDEAAPYMDKKILRYIDEQITDSFECFKDCDILAFDWYDVQSEKKEDFKMLLYLDGKDLLVFCETSEAEEKANMILHTMTGEEGATNERLFYHFFSLLLKGDMDFLNNLEEEISNNEDKVLSLSLIHICVRPVTAKSFLKKRLIVLLMLNYLKV